MAAGDPAQLTHPTHPDTEALLKNIFALDLSQCDLAVCLAAVEPHEEVPAFRRINLSERLVTTFRRSITTALEPFRKGLHRSDLILQDFTVDTAQLAYEIEHLDLTLYNAIIKQITPLARYQELPHFDQAERSFIDGLRFSVLVVQPPTGDTVYFYRKYTRVQQLGESANFAVRLLNENLYDQVTEPVLLFDRLIDCFSYQKHMFIAQKNNFYTIFNFIEELEKNAEELLEVLRQKELIINFDRFSHDCLQNRSKVLKLKNISMQPYLATITIEQLERAIHQHNLKVPIVQENGKKMLQYDPRDPWGILHLLDDVYLGSAMTATTYQAKGKVRTKPSPRKK